MDEPATPPARGIESLLGEVGDPTYLKWILESVPPPVWSVEVVGIEGEDLKLKVIAGPSRRTFEVDAGTGSTVIVAV